jgi:multidrug efflux pump subunit AcrA (membrane-fusion protein)
LQAQLDAAQAELRRREVEDAEHRMAALRQAEADAKEAAASAASAAQAEEVERQRRSAWVNFRTEEAVRGGPDALHAMCDRPHAGFMDSLVGDGWPPGYRPAARVVAIPEAEDVSGTPFGKIMARMAPRTR